MSKLLLIAGKNAKIFLKSRKKSLILILSPLLIIFLTGIAFDNLNEYKINIAIYAPNSTELTNLFITKLNNEQFRAIKANSETECIDSSKIGLTHTCVVFPSNLTLEGKNRGILIYIDYSNLNLAWVIRDRLFSKVQEQSKEITKQLTDNILSKLIITKNDLASDQRFLALAFSNENRTLNKTLENLNVIGKINATLELNASDLERLKSVMESVKSANDYATLQSNDFADFTISIINSGDFSDQAKANYKNSANRYRNAVMQQQKYIETLFNPAFSGSVNNTLDNLEFKFNRAEKNANATKSLILAGKKNLYDANTMVSSNIKHLTRLIYSVEGLQKELENVKSISAQQISEPVQVNIEPLSSYKSHLDYIFPTIMALVIMFASLFLSTMIVVSDLNTPAFFRNVISPNESYIFFFSAYLTNLLFIGIQILVMLGIAAAIFFSQIIGSLVYTIIICFAIATFFIVLGMGIGYLFRTEQMSILAATFCSTIMLFLSSILLPIENMPEFFLKIVQYNPLLISISLLRKSILFGESMSNLAREVSILIVFTGVLLIAYEAVHIYSKKQKIL